MIIINYFIVCIIFGTTFLAIKVGVNAGINPFFAAGSRFLLSGLIVIVFFSFKKRKDILHLLLSKKLFYIGFCVTFLLFASLYWAEQYITSGLAAVLMAIGPLQIFLIQTFMGDVKVKFLHGLGLFLGISGVILISLPGLTGEVSLHWFLGTLAVIVGQLFYSIGTVYSKKVFSMHHEISPFLFNGIQMFHGGVMLLLLSTYGGIPKIDLLFDKDFQCSLWYLIFIGSIGGHGLYYWLVNKTNPIFPSTWLYVAPIIALMAGYVMLHEPIKPITVIGAMFVLTGVLFINKDMLRKILKHPKALKKIFRNS